MSPPRIGITTAIMTSGLLAYEEAFERTETEWGPWTIVEATDRRYTRVKIYKTVITALEDGSRIGAGIAWNWNA